MRIQSVDIFRGLTILVMIFVNDLAGVSGLPWWTYHMPRGVDGMTYVDAVFPAFLFIVGVSIPLAVAARLGKGDSVLRLGGHIVTRSIALIILGIFLANSGKVDAALTGMRGGAWTVLGLFAAILLWNVYPRSGPQTLYRAMKLLGAAGLVVLFAIFRRRAPDGSAAWLDFSYWEILGLIGEAYLAGCILYVPFRRKVWAPFAALTLLTITNTALRWGALASIVLAGVCASSIILEKRIAATPRARSAVALTFAAVLFLAGWTLRPLGLSKLGATPSWCLWCSAVCTVLFVALYGICDVRQATRWAAVVRPAGANTLLTYLLPDIVYGAFGSLHLGTLTRHGGPGAVKAAAFSFAVLGVAGILTKLKLRLQI